MSDALNRDVQRLEELGVESHFKRDMSPWANFALGFTYLSPVVGIYVTFGIALAAGGPPMIWALVIAGLGQLLVALVFGEVVSQYPIAGGVYPWARRLWGRKWSWMTGWIYMVALMATITALAYGAGPYFAALIGVESSQQTSVLLGLILLALATLINLSGTKSLAVIAKFGFAAELIGAIAVGVWLLLTYRHHDLSVLFDSFGSAGSGSYVAAFLAAGLIGVYQYYGFEACGDVAEEVEDPGRLIPKAMRMTIYVGGAAAIFITLSLILAVTDFAAVISGADADPINTVLAGAFGPVGSKIVLAIVLISFISGALSLQAATSRLLYSYARDDMIIGSSRLSQFSERHGVPSLSIIVSGLLPGIALLYALVDESGLLKIVSFATAGIYLGFQMVVLAALRARLKGWRPTGQFTLGRWGLVTNIAALVWGVLAITNMVWPRSPGAPWYDEYVVLIAFAVVIGLGSLYLFATGRAGRSDAPYGDAIPGSRSRSPLHVPEKEIS
ncbi:MAG: amino acid permease [Propionibacteriaceae bacterium]|nr:amino acid permease [Propionibacteriaceae bacterium]